MPQIKGEPINQKLDDIESGVVKSKCLSCGHRQFKRVLTIDGRRFHHNFIGVCVNPNCFRYSDLEQMPSWVSA